MTTPIEVEVPGLPGVKLEALIDPAGILVVRSVQGVRRYSELAADTAILRPLHDLLGKLIAAQDAEAAPAPDAEVSR